MKIHKFSDRHYKVFSIIPAMQVGDWFRIDETGEQFKLVVRCTLFKGSTTIDIMTFECNGRDYKCNVWNHRDVFYFQEV